MRTLNRIAVGLVVVVGIFTWLFIWFLRSQGAGAVDWPKLGQGRIKFDAQGIPDITGKTWEEVIRRQGLVHASERLWQMDLSRRAAAGRLAEWFGEDAVANDTRKIQENWLTTAIAGVDLLTEDERQSCQWYADGVNQFISEAKDYWATEYTLLRATPEPWECKDTLLVLLNMAADLGLSADREMRQALWRENLSDEWQAFLFPRVHPWAEPYFNSGKGRPLQLPPMWQYLPPRELQAQRQPKQRTQVAFNDPILDGSNAWAWSDGKATFLAGDPHLGQRVPQLWYGNRLHIESTKEWVAGTSLPGIPGVIIGTNGTIGWSFTNLGDDVDDYLEETLDHDELQYLAYEQAGRQHWRRIIKKTVVLKVRGQEDKQILARATHRGPLLTIDVKGKPKFFTRQWLGLRRDMLHLPTVALNRARNWQEFNRALDYMRVPSQVAIYADKDANIGFRTTGVDIERALPGYLLPKATAGEWKSVGDGSKQRRYYRPAQANEVRWIANANAQIWDDGDYQRWSADDRRERIATVLKEQAPATQKTMEELQLDTYSRFGKVLLAWVIDNAANVDNKTREQFSVWEKWDGFSHTDETTFADALFLEAELSDILIQQIRGHFFTDSDPLPDYEGSLRRAWLVKLFAQPGATQAFGLKESQIVAYLLQRLPTAAHRVQPELKRFSVVNQWDAAHPFAKLPVIGRLFAVRNFPQFGERYLVKAEAPKHGPSVRIVLNLQDVRSSSWIMPVGQSAHIGSAHYRDLQPKWHQGHERLPLLGQLQK